MLSLHRDDISCPMKPCRFAGSVGSGLWLTVLGSLFRNFKFHKMKHYHFDMILLWMFATIYVWKRKIGIFRISTGHVFIFTLTVLEKHFAAPVRPLRDQRINVLALRQRMIKENRCPLWGNEKGLKTTWRRQSKTKEAPGGTPNGKFQ